MKPEEPNCTNICKETSEGFPFCDCQHTPPLKLVTLEFIKVSDSNDTEPEEPNCTNICKETSEGFPFCDCQHTPPLKLITLEFAKFIKTVDSNDTEPAEPNCTEICKETSEGFPFCDCQKPLRLVTLDFGIKTSGNNDPKDLDCEELCKTGDGLPFCDCGHPIPPKKAKDEPDCDGICFLENCDGFPMCDCNCVGQCGCLPTSETLQVAKSEEPNCDCSHFDEQGNLLRGIDNETDR